MPIPPTTGPMVVSDTWLGITRELARAAVAANSGLPVYLTVALGWEPMRSLDAIQEVLEELRALDLPGVYSEKFAADVTGLDELGMWIEHPNYKVVPVYDQQETYIPPEQRREESHRAVILVRWDYIATVIQFPERTGWRAGADESDIGFKPRLNGNDTKEDAGG